MKHPSSSLPPLKNAVSPRRLYDARAAEGDIVFDGAQRAALTAIDDLYVQLITPEPSARFPFFGIKKKENIKGIYLYGGVGRGKTMLMDLFYKALPDTITKGRWHFHAFMLKVHDYLHQAQQHTTTKALDDVLIDCADHYAASLKVLCFDELVVRDVADAMLLSRLFERMIARGVVIVFTTNTAPDDLYAGGWQRERFMPFVDLIKHTMTVIQLDHGRDFRLRNIATDTLYRTPADSEAMRHTFMMLARGEKGSPMTMLVKGHSVEIPLVSGRVAYFTFADLCAKPLAAIDYLALCEAFDTILIDQIPVLSEAKRNEAKRFIALIDALYDTRRRVIIGADAEIGELYSGFDHAEEFSRTKSRLKEMRTQAYWDSAGA